MADKFQNLIEAIQEKLEAILDTKEKTSAAAGAVVVIGAVTVLAGKWWAGSGSVASMSEIFKGLDLEEILAVLIFLPFCFGVAAALKLALRSQSSLIFISVLMSIIITVLQIAIWQIPGFAVQLGIGFLGGDLISQSILFFMQYGYYIAGILFVAGILEKAAKVSASIENASPTMSDEYTTSPNADANIIHYAGFQIHKITNSKFFVSGHDQEFVDIASAINWIDSTRK